MPRISVVFSLVGAFVLSGCGEGQPNPFEPDASPDYPDILAFKGPNMEEVRERPDIQDASAGAVGEPQSIEEFDFEFDDDLSGKKRPYEQIFSARTKAGFHDGHAWAEGAHSYIGNVGAVSTTARVMYAGQFLAERSATEQRYTPFLLNFGRKDFVSVYVPVYSDHECGLTVEGTSQHSAAWQFFQGVGTANWGGVVTSSFSSRASQAECPDGFDGVGAGGAESAGGSVCFVEYWYDKETGEVLDSEILFCTGDSGGL
jgi:hypothetical protein